MNDRNHRRAPWWGVLIALLLLGSAAPLTRAAEPIATCPPCAAAPAPAPFALRSILGNQTAMIQVAIVVGAIGIFWLSRSIK